MIRALRRIVDRRWKRRTAKAMTLANPGKELALIGCEKRREKVRAIARQMRRELGLPPLTALESRASGGA